MTDSYTVYVPKPQGDLRAWLQGRWNRISGAAFFIVHGPGPQDVADEYQVLMCIHHDGPDPRPMSRRADEFLRQAIERQRVVPLSHLGEPLDGAELHEAYTPIPESWLESVYNAITLKVTAFDSGINEIFITVGDSRAADCCQVFVQQLTEIPGAKLVSAEPATRDGGAPKRGPTEKTRLRAEVFREIKEAHRNWGLDKVADEAMLRYPDIGGGITAETVRHAYDAMGWEGERADRIR